MNHKNNIEHYGEEYAELQRLVMAGNGENVCSEKEPEL